MEPLEEPRVGGDVIDRMKEESMELLKAVVATDAEDEEREDDDATKAHAELEAVLAELADVNEEIDRLQREDGEEREVEVVDEVIVVAVEEESPWWIETKFGPWAARHQGTLRVWLVVFLALYVSLFALMIAQHGLRGLSELSTMAMARDLLWVVLMAIVILLTISKRY